MALKSIEGAGAAGSAAMIPVGHATEGVSNRYAIGAKQNMGDALIRLAGHLIVVKAESKNEIDVSDSLL